MKKHFAFVSLWLAIAPFAFALEISLQSVNGQWLCAEGGGGQAVYANRGAASTWETFTVVDLNGGSLESGDYVYLQAANGQWLCAEGGGGQAVVANRNSPAGWETFRIHKANGGGVIGTNDQVWIQAGNNQYWCAEGGGGGEVNANRDNPSGWETFTIVVSGGGGGNTPPTSTVSVSQATINVGQQVVVSVAANDANGNLQYINIDQLAPTNGFYGPGDTGTESPPNNGGYSIGGQTGSYTRHLTLTLNVAGTYTFRGAANDGTGWYYSSNTTDVTVIGNSSPQTVSVSAGNATAGSSMTFTGRATDSDSNLTWIHFYVTGPGYSGWNYIGSAEASGGDATRTLNWTPPQKGEYAVHIRAQDTWNAYDSNGNVAANFSVSGRPPGGTIRASTTSIQAGQSVVISVDGTDPDGDLHYINIDQTSPTNGYYGPGDTGTHTPPNNGGYNLGGYFASRTRDLTLTLGVAGTYVFRGAMNDDSGWYYTPNTVTVSVTVPPDTTPPSTPTGFQAGLVTPNSFVLNWQASTGDPVAYEVTKYWMVGQQSFVEPMGSTPIPSMSFSNLLPNTTYTLNVRARDAAGNFSSPGLPTVTTPNGNPPSGEQSAWLDANGDGIRDEIIRAGTTRLNYYISNIMTEVAAYLGYDFNNSWMISDLLYDAGTWINGFNLGWNPLWYNLPSPTTFIDLNVDVALDEGYDYIFKWRNSSGSFLGSDSIFAQSSGINTLHKFGWSADDLYGMAFSLTRLGKPLTSLQLSNGGSVFNLANGGATSVTLTPGSNLDLRGLDSRGRVLAGGPQVIWRILDAAGVEVRPWALGDVFNLSQLGAGNYTVQTRLDNQSGPPQSFNVQMLHAFPGKFTGTMSIGGGATLTVSGGTVSVTVNGTTIGVGPGGGVSTTVGGVSMPRAVGAHTISGVGSIEVRANGTVTLTIGNDFPLPVLRNVTFDIGLAGFGIGFPNGTKVGVAATGGVSIRLPSGTVAGAVNEILDILGLPQGAGVAIRSILGVQSPIGQVGGMDVSQVADLEITVNNETNRVQVNQAVKDISFSGGHPVKRDSDGSTYGSASDPHWVDINRDGFTTTGILTGEHNYPLAYTKGTPMTVAATFQVATSYAGQTVSIKATSPSGLNILVANRSIASDGTFTLPATPSTSNVTDSIRFHNAGDNSAFTIFWEIKIGDNSWVSAGITNHTVYLTWENPIGTATNRLFETVLNIGSRNAAGKTTAAEIVTSIFAEFTDQKVERVLPSSGFREAESKAMTYWGDPNASYFSTENLLKFGDGKCGAWGRFFLDILRAQGIDATYVSRFAPPAFVLSPTQATSNIGVLNTDFNNRYTGFTATLANPQAGLMLVKHWNLSDKFAPIDSDGVSAQGNVNSNPKSFFTDHVLVKYGSTYYDPSYGTSFGSIVAWESSSIDGYGILIQTTPNLPDHAQTTPALPPNLDIYVSGVENAQTANIEDTVDVSVLIPIFPELAEGHSYPNP